MTMAALYSLKKFVGGISSGSNGGHVGIVILSVWCHYEGVMNSLVYSTLLLDNTYIVKLNLSLNLYAFTIKYSL